MTPERWRQVDALLHRALERPARERPAWLADAGGEDPSLGREVESLLAVERARDFLDEPAFSIHDDPDLGRRIGPYRTLRLLGRGGMGAVYLAAEEEGELAVKEEGERQRVALKLIKRGLQSDEILRLFRSERQILADLHHPNIAGILGAGTTPGDRPYIAMEYVDGQPIDLHCDARKLPLRARLHLFRQVCSAVQFAHRHRVVHRDLKPGNILVDAEGVPKLLDFGIAKLMGSVAGNCGAAEYHRPMTLEYASPEQARGESSTPRSDVYSLGMLLYQLLTGHSPYSLSGRDPSECIRIICDREPLEPSTAVGRTEEIRSVDGEVLLLTPEAVSRSRGSDPHTLRRRLTGDLDAIVLNALRKEPQHRYGSVEALSEDIGRHLLQGVSPSSSGNSRGAEVGPA